MSLRLKLPLHGRSHRHNGSDPIATFIEYDVENVGDWLYVETTDSGGPENYGVAFVDNIGQSAFFEIRSKGGGITIDGIGSDYPDFEAFLSNYQVTVHSGPASINADGNVSLVSDADGSFSADGSLTLTSNGVTDLNCATSPLTITVGSKVFRFQGDGNLHIPTGASVIADT